MNGEPGLWRSSHIRELNIWWWSGSFLILNLQFLGAQVVFSPFLQKSLNSRKCQAWRSVFSMKLKKCWKIEAWCKKNFGYIHLRRKNKEETFEHERRIFRPTSFHKLFSKHEAFLYSCFFRLVMFHYLFADLENYQIRAFVWDIFPVPATTPLYFSHDWWNGIIKLYHFCGPL